MRHVPYVNLPAQFAADREAIIARLESVFERGDFVDGAAVERLEARVAAYCGVRHAVALNSGTDALILGMRALGIGPGDEVITAPNSFIATAGAIAAVGARPVFADVRDDLNIDPDAVAAAVGPRTKAIMPVHLGGRIADMDALMAVAERHGLPVVEDAAQAMGSAYGQRRAGAFGRIGCFSTHPLKNFNAAGDGGLLTTDDADVAARVRRLRNHGLIDRDTAVEWGYVSRMDTVQAALLLDRLDQLDRVIARRRANAVGYRAGLSSTDVFAPPCRPIEFNSFHTFIIQVERRDGLRAHLAERGIGTAVHYPVPIHLQPAAAALSYGRGAFPVAERQADRILSVPIHQFLSPADIDYVAESINRFYG